MTDLRRLRDEALALPEDSRAELIVDLIASLDGEPDEGVEAAWREEIARRVQKVESGQSEPIPWERVYEELQRRLKNK